MVIKRFLRKQTDDTIKLEYTLAKNCSIMKNTNEIVAIAKNFFFGNKYEIPITIKPINPDIWLIHNSFVKLNKSVKII